MGRAADMPQPKLTYAVFPASNGAGTFWRWEVRQIGRSDVLATGALYGSKEEAKDIAEMEIVRANAVLDRHRHTKAS
jgi:hypothetical protein